jgi:hypothetical protein
MARHFLDFVAFFCVPSFFFATLFTFFLATAIT